MHQLFLSNRNFSIFVFLLFPILTQAQEFDKQAHRGGRGLMPQNTIEAMVDAVHRNINTLELDVQISKDKQVIVSHDAILNPKITLNADGKPLSASDKMIVYSLSYDSIQKFDVGLKPDPNFPRKKNIPAHIPLLSNLIDSIEIITSKNNKQIFYNIEIKSIPKGDGIFHPAVSEFVDLVMRVVSAKGIEDRTIIQSFDKRALQETHKKFRDVKTAYLINVNPQKSIDILIVELGFKPDILAPHYSLVNPEMVKYCNEQKLRLIPWTVNDIQEIKRLKEMGVKGIITDYPDLLDEL